MVCSVTELNTLSHRYRTHLLRDENVLRRPQRERGLDLCDYMRELHPIIDDPKIKARTPYGYGVSPTGTGKTTLASDMIIGMNTLPGGDFVMGKEQGRRAVIHVPTNLLLDRWEEELLGLPDGNGGRLKGNFSGTILPEHVGIYHASDSLEKKQEALHKPIVLITYDSARILATKEPPLLIMNDFVREKVEDLLKNAVPAAKFTALQKILQASVLENEALQKLFTLVQEMNLPKKTVDTLSDILEIDFVSEPARQQLREDFLNTLHSTENPNRACIAVLDEVDDRPRGDATCRYVQDHLLTNCFTFGLTATHLYRNGRTTGDYIFGGLKPVFETTFQEAVNNKEIAPMRNIALEVSIPEDVFGEIAGLVDKALTRMKKKGASEEELDYSDAEMEKMARLSGINDLAVQVLLKGCDPDTGKRYMDMKSVWYCANVSHAELCAQKINEAIEKHLANHPEEQARWKDSIVTGEDGKQHIRYAEAVSGKMNDTEFNAVITRFRKGQTRATPNAQIMTRGFDDREAELCFQLCPSRSPNRVMQQGGRVMRLNRDDPKKIANVITFMLPGVEQVLFGQLAGGIQMIPQDYEFPPTAGQDADESRNPRHWVDVKRVPNVITNDQEFRIFRERQGKTPVKKPENMFTCEEMAQKMNPHATVDRLQLETERLRRRLYEPLSAAYQIREARQAFIGLDNTVQPEENMLAVRKQSFPVSRMGNFMVKGKEQFCIDKGLAHLCGYALFAAPKNRPQEVMIESEAQLYITGNGKDSNPEFSALIGKLKDAYLSRPHYAQLIEINGVTIPVRSVGFYRKPTGDREAVDFCMSPDALLPIYQIYQKVEATEAKTWWDKKFSEFKTRQWLNLDDISRDLNINIATTEFATLTQQFNRIFSKVSRVGPQVNPYQEHDVKVRSDGKDLMLKIAKRKVPGNDKPQSCLHESSIGAMECLLQRVSAEDVDAQMEPRGRKRHLK